MLQEEAIALGILKHEDQADDESGRSNFSNQPINQ
jgi:hypothetical protein